VAAAGGEAPPSAARLLFTMGSPVQFTLAAIAIHVFAGLVFIAGIGLQALHGRAGGPFLALSSAFVAGLAFSAYWLTQAMPLDAAIDENGVTFSGAARAWRAIRGVERVSATYVRVRADGGDLLVGPGAPRELDGVRRAIEAHLA
jgi:hypothetical protein